MTVAIACAFNVFGDLLFVAGFHLQASGAAIATVLAQALSVGICLIVVKKRGLPFPFGKKNLRFHGALTAKMLQTGFPIALQDSLVAISFLVISAIVNRLGLLASAGVGVAEKVCAFIMLVPSAFSQSLSAFVAQNVGAGKPDRAKTSMYYGMAASLAAGIVMAYAAYFHGDFFCGIFTTDMEVVREAWDYMRAYAIDTLLVSFLFCFIGYFNGNGKTAFVMAQGLIGAFGVRIPVSYVVSRSSFANLFTIGLATPASTVVQIVLCAVYYARFRRKPRSF